MTNQLAKRPPDIDPEFAAIYDSVDDSELPRKSDRPASPSNQSGGATANGGSPRKEDDFEALARMAKENQANQVDRKELPVGRQIEHDVTNICKLGWDYLTR